MLNVTRNRALVDMLRNRVNPEQFNCLWYDRLDLINNRSVPSCTLAHALRDEGLATIGFPQARIGERSGEALDRCFPPTTLPGCSTEYSSHGAAVWFGWTFNQYSIICLTSTDPQWVADQIEQMLLDEALDVAYAEETVDGRMAWNRIIHNNQVSNERSNSDTF